jgi:hypothetical protein
MTAPAGMFKPFLVLACLLAFGRAALAVTPDSPEVKAVIKKGLKFLETAKDDRLGGKCLIGLAFLKSGEKEEHPQIVAAVDQCKRVAAGGPKGISEDIYSTGIAIIFLCNLNPSKYQAEIRKLMDSIEARQKRSGAWGYPTPHELASKSGDTSMTQYGVLSTWEVSKIGLRTSIDSVEQVSNWLLRTQDSGGNYGYQGIEGEIGKLVKQDSAKNGMTAAGMGCLYLCADMLHLIDPAPEVDPNLPAALKPVKKAGKIKPLSNKVDVKALKRAMERGNTWMRKNYKIDPPGFTHYYLYALERYESILESVEGKNVKEPKWYNDGYSYLKRTQAKDGSWKSEAGEAPDTAFGVLFLLRSMKKSIERAKTYGEGTLVVGRGLPSSVQEVHMRGARIVGKLRGTPADDMVRILEQPADPGYVGLTANPDELVSALHVQDEKTRPELLARLRSLAQAGPPEARGTAVRVLGRLRDMESATTLIYALDDPDPHVAREADEALVFLSRKLSAARLPEPPTREARQVAVDRWKEWFLAVRPDAEFKN